MILGRFFGRRKEPLPIPPMLGFSPSPRLAQRLLGSGLASWVDPEVGPSLFLAEDVMDVAFCLGPEFDECGPVAAPLAAQRFFALAHHYRHNVDQPMASLTSALLDRNQWAMLQAMLSPDALHRHLQIICAQSGIEAPPVTVQASLTTESHRSCSVEEHSGTARIAIPLGFVLSTWVLVQGLVAYASGWDYPGKRLCPYHFSLLDSVHDVPYRFCAAAQCLAQLVQPTLSARQLEWAWCVTMNATTFQLLHELGHVAARHSTLLGQGAVGNRGMEIEADKAAATMSAEMSCAAALAERDFLRALPGCLEELSWTLNALHRLLDPQCDPARERVDPRTGRCYPPLAVRFDTASEQIAETLRRVEESGETLEVRDRKGRLQKRMVPRGADLVGAWRHVHHSVWKEVHVALGKLAGEDWGPEPTYLDDEYRGLLQTATEAITKELGSLGTFRRLLQEDTNQDNPSEESVS